MGPEEGDEEDKGAEFALRGPARDRQDDGGRGDRERTRKAAPCRQLRATREHVGRRDGEEHRACVPHGPRGGGGPLLLRGGRGLPPARGPCASRDGTAPGTVCG